jgi:hypothetical protein
MDDAVTAPTVVELPTTLEPTTRDDFADEPADHRPTRRLAALAEARRDHGETEK